MDGVMFITGGLWSGADGSGISGTPPLAPVRSAPVRSAFWFLQNDVCMCEECAGWDVMVVDSARIYQAKLERCFTRYACAKHQGSVGASGSRFGTGDMPHRVVQVDFLSSVNSCLNNLAKLPASLLSQAECLASSRPTSSKPAACSKVQKAFLAEGAWGGGSL
ncbi:hypothetical protein E2C01_053604 [Portunus trituberculatus]|uniref:Uncharacterized protein n=1 Tax=Portunus trituberculatus TaxID=210409 RepID=A0A5B7GH73_PORTR|nr:hypothetical protein [Portunus trituberculatus]